MAATTSLETEPAGNWLTRHRLRLTLALSLIIPLAVWAVSAVAVLTSIEQFKLHSEVRADAAQIDQAVDILLFRGETYLRIVPRDYPEYFRDIEIFHGELLRNIEVIEDLAIHLHAHATDIPSAIPAIARFRNMWDAFTTGIEERLGPDTEAPRLEWAAQYIVDNRASIDEGSRTIIHEINRAIDAQASSVQRANIAYLSLAVGLSALAGLVLYFSFARRIRRTVAACRRVEGGEFGYQIEDTSNDELSQLSHAFNKASRRTRVARDLIDALQRGHDIEAALQCVMDSVGQMLSIRWVALVEPAEFGDFMLTYHAVGIDLDIDCTSALQGMMTQDSNPRVLPADTFGLHAATGDSVIAVPLIYQSGTNPVLLLGLDSGTKVTQERIDFLRNFAPVLGHGLEKCELSERLLLGTVYGLSKLAESRDPETGLHLTRMSMYSEVIADELRKTGEYPGVDRRFVRDVLRFAPMHDIGKVGIRDSILLKPGKLDPDEWKEMQRHALIGGEVLRHSASQMREGLTNVLGVAIEVAEGHHEKWDGSGYPYGLKGEEISLAARVVALGDVFDALTSRRPYKEPWPIKKALDLIREESGRHFDPAVVAAFERGMDRVRVIHERYGDELSVAVAAPTATG